MDFSKLSFLMFLVISCRQLVIISSPCAILQHDAIGSTLPSEELESEVLEECRARQDRLFRAELQDSVGQRGTALTASPDVWVQDAKEMVLWWLLVVGDFTFMFILFNPTSTSGLR